jgi:hypothetical protein
MFWQFPIFQPSRIYACRTFLPYFFSNRASQKPPKSLAPAAGSQSLQFSNKAIDLEVTDKYNINIFEKKYACFSAASVVLS